MSARISGPFFVPIAVEHSKYFSEPSFCLDGQSIDLPPLFVFICLDGVNWAHQSPSEICQSFS